jgi:hypothetical protein
MVLVGCSASIPAAVPSSGSADQPLVTSYLNDDNLPVMTALDGTPLLKAKGVSLYTNSRTKSTIEPNVELIEHPTGFDLHLTFHNNTNKPMGLGTVRMGTFALGTDITYQDFATISTPRRAKADTFKSLVWNYPNRIYSPAFVLRNDSYAVGISIQYPIMDYHHGIRLALRSARDRYAQGEHGGWVIEYQYTDYGDRTPANKLYYPILLQPGQTRSYTISVRATDRPNEWVRTLVPYRDFFRSTYGGVSYQRDPRPILGVIPAGAVLATPENPRGFKAFRPDLNGWTRFINTIKSNRGWRRVMIWTPSGVYRVNTKNNYPFQFTTGWLDDPELATATDPVKGLPALARTMDLGLWWGRSLQVADKWDDDELEDFNPDNPKHVAAAFAEMDLAVQAGATIIGLDAFTHRRTPIWKAYSWLQTLKSRYPKVRFVTERVSCDILHTLTPTYFRGHTDWDAPDTPSDLNRITNPHYMADFLLPGHETWGAMSYDGVKKYFGYRPDAEEVRRDIADVASKGFVPLFYTNIDLLHSYPAAQSWLYTVPKDLQIDTSSQWGLNMDKRRSILADIRGSRRVSVKAAPHNPHAGLPPGVTRDDLVNSLNRARALRRSPPSKGPGSE